MIRIVLAASLAAASGAPAAKPDAGKDAAAPVQQKMSPRPKASEFPEVPPPAQVDAEALELPPLKDPEVLDFLTVGRIARGRDASLKLDWDGPGAAQLRLSWDALERRNDLLAEGDMMARAVLDTVRMYYESDGGIEPAAIRAKLVRMVGTPMHDARTAYFDAIGCEERRLFFVEKAIAEATAANAAIPGVDAALVHRRVAAIRSGAVKRAVTALLDGYRDLALGIVSYLDGDSFGALQRVRSAAVALPDFSVAHAFLGSLYFLFDQKDAALASWRRANELDPSNVAVQQALVEYGRTTKQSLKQR